jgi:2-methylcitrate dehydratase PrpD
VSRSVGGSASGRAVTWAWNLAHRPPPPTARDAAARHILDALGCAVGAARSGAVGRVLSVSHRTSGWGPATLLDGTGTVTVEDAALGNGILVHCLDFDDTHAASLVHVSAAVLPATLAAAEQVEATGMDLLGAYLAGAEIACRLGAAADGGFHRRGFQPTALVGVSASALAVSWLRELDPHVAQHAVGIAGSLAAGSMEFLHSDATTKQLHPGLAARNALLAVDLATAGATGPPEAWEGSDGLFASYAELRVEADELVDGLGSRWETERVGIKRYPCCHLAHSSIDAARSLAADGVSAADVEDLVVVVHPDAAGITCEPFPAGQAATHPGADARADPDTEYEARFSLPWCVAVALIDGVVDGRTFEPTAVRRPDVLALAARVRCELADRPHAAATDQPGHLRVRLSDGETLVVMAPGGLGGPDHPVDDDELVAKFVLNCGGHDDARPVAARVLALEDEPSVADLAAAVGALAR